MTEIDETKPAAVEPKKTPRKPRPSELAAKAAKKKKPVPKKKVAKPKAKKPRKVAKKVAKKKAKPAVKSDARLKRLDMRLTKAEKIRVTAAAKRLRRTVTSLVMEALEKIK